MRLRRWIYASGGDFIQLIFISGRSWKVTTNDSLITRFQRDSYDSITLFILRSRVNDDVENVKNVRAALSPSASRDFFLFRDVFFFESFEKSIETKIRRLRVITIRRKRRRTRWCDSGELHSSFRGSKKTPRINPRRRRFRWHRRRRSRFRRKLCQDEIDSERR